MSFFLDRSGTYYPIARIVSIGGDRNGFANVELEGGDIVSVYKNTVQQIMISSGPNVPASPNTYLLQFNSDDDDEFVSKDPIVAWSTVKGHASPILVDAEFDDVQGNMAYLFPDGKVYGRCGEIWNDQEEWKNSQIEWAARAKAARQTREKAKEAK